MRLQLGTRGSLSWPRRPNITYVDVREQYIYGRLGGRDPLAHGTEQDAELDILIIPYTPTETRMESSCTCVSAAQKLRDGPWTCVVWQQRRNQHGQEGGTCSLSKPVLYN